MAENKNESKEKTSDKPSDIASEAKSDVRLDPIAEAEGKIKKGQIGGFRRAADDVVVATVLEVRKLADRVKLALSWQGVTIPNKLGFEKEIQVGKARGQFWPNIEELENYVKIERSGIGNL